MDGCSTWKNTLPARVAVAQVVAKAVDKVVAVAEAAMAMVEDVVVVVAKEAALATVEDVADAITMASTGARAVVCMRCCCCCRQHIPSELTRLCFCFFLSRRPPSHLPSTMPFFSSLACLSDCCVCLCFARPGLQRLARSVAVRSNSGVLKFRPAFWPGLGSGLQRAKVPAVLGLLRAKVPTSHGPRAPARRGSGQPRALARQGSGQAWAPGSSAPIFRSALGFGAPRFWMVGLGLWRAEVLESRPRAPAR